MTIKGRKESKSSFKYEFSGPQKHVGVILMSSLLFREERNQTLVFSLHRESQQPQTKVPLQTGAKQIYDH